MGTDVDYVTSVEGSTVIGRSAPSRICRLGRIFAEQHGNKNGYIHMPQPATRSTNYHLLRHRLGRIFEEQHGNETVTPTIMPQYVSISTANA